MSPSTDVRENREFASELKFVADPAKAEQIRNWASTRLLPDPNASDGAIDTYRITSLYFADQGALQAAFGSAEGQATAADFQRIAPPGTRMFVEVLG